MKVGEIKLGMNNNFPYLCLVVGMEDDKYVVMEMSDQYDVYVGDVFGTPFGVDCVDPEDPACLTEIWDDVKTANNTTFAQIGKDEMKRIIHESRIPDGFYGSLDDE